MTGEKRLLSPMVQWGRTYRRRFDRIWAVLSVRAKLTVLFSSLILFMTAFFYGFAVYQTTREVKVNAIYKGEAVAEALKGEVTYAIQNNTLPNLDFTFRRITSSRNDVAYVALLDTRSVILASSDPEHDGQLFDDAASRRALRSDSTRVQFQRVNIDGENVDLCAVFVPIFSHGRRLATLRIAVSLTQYLIANGPRIRWQVAVFALPFALLSMLIVMRLSTSVTRPLKELAQAVTEVSHGNYGVQLPLNRRDELGELAQAFNKMAAHLNENFQKVSDMANRDGLTGLYNSRFFQEALSREMDRVKRSGRPLSLIILDADRFKRINDRFGHPVGDQILQHISHTARSVLRGYDVLARYGGEEFIAMLTDTTGAQAVLLAERLRKMVEQRPHLTEEGDAIKMTISVGVAQARAPYDKRDLISQADQALYRAKETGRNKVILFKPLPATDPLSRHFEPQG